MSEQVALQLCTCPLQTDWRKLGGVFHCVLPHQCWTGKAITCRCDAECCVGLNERMAKAGMFNA